jgi:hypothetical protein
MNDHSHLIKFDFNHTFGPSKGITRLQSWDRAQRIGLNTSPEIKRLILEYNLNKSVLDKFL